MLHWSYLNVVGVLLSVVAVVWDRGNGGAHRIAKGRTRVAVA